MFIASALALVGGIAVAFVGGGLSGRRRERGKSDADTLRRIGKGQDAASAAKGKDPDAVVEKNNARW